MYRLLLAGALALAFLSGSVNDSRAVSYGNFSSPTGSVSFLNVADNAGLYGMPSVSANTLDFNPNAFELECASGAGGCPPITQALSDVLTFQIDADAGFFIEDIVLSEAGDTFLLEAAGYGATTVSANVFIDILELDNVSVSGINSNEVMTFTSGGTFDTLSHADGAHIWNGGLSIDVDAVIAAASQSGKATLVTISLSNVLTAEANNGAIARIEKKDLDGLAITVIPEPTTGVLMLIGLASLATTRRRP